MVHIKMYVHESCGGFDRKGVKIDNKLYKNSPSYMREINELDDIFGIRHTMEKTQFEYFSHHGCVDDVNTVYDDVLGESRLDITDISSWARELCQKSKKYQACVKHFSGLEAGSSSEKKANTRVVMKYGVFDKGLGERAPSLNSYLPGWRECMYWGEVTIKLVLSPLGEVNGGVHKWRKRKGRPKTEYTTLKMAVIFDFRQDLNNLSRLQSPHRPNEPIVPRTRRDCKHLAYMVFRNPLSRIFPTSEKAYTITHDYQIGKDEKVIGECTITYTDIWMFCNKVGKNITSRDLAFLYMFVILPKFYRIEGKGFDIVEENPTVDSNDKNKLAEYMKPYRECVFKVITEDSRKDVHRFECSTEKITDKKSVHPKCLANVTVQKHRS